MLRNTDLRPCLEVGMWEKRTRLRHETHSKVKTAKTLQRQGTFGTCDVQEVHAAVARSTFRCQSGKNTSVSEYFWQLALKTPHVWTTFGSWDVEKVHVVVAQSIFWRQNAETLDVRTAFGSWDVENMHAVVARSTFRSEKTKCTICSHHFWLFKRHFCGKPNGFRTLPKVSKTWWFCGSCKNDGRRGTLEEDLQRCILGGRRNSRHMRIRDIRRSALI